MLDPYSENVFSQLNDIKDTLAQVSQNTTPKTGIEQMLAVVDGRMSLLALAISLMALIAGVFAAWYAYRGYFYQKKSAKSLQEANSRHPSLWPLTKKIYDNFAPLTLLFEKDKERKTYYNDDDDKKKEYYFYNRYQYRLLLSSMKLPTGPTRPEKYEIYSVADIYDKASEMNEMVFEYNNLLFRAEEVMEEFEKQCEVDYSVEAKDNRRIVNDIYAKLNSLSLRLLEAIFQLENYVDIRINPKYRNYTQKDNSLKKQICRLEKMSNSKVLTLFSQCALLINKRLENLKERHESNVRYRYTESLICLSIYVVSLLDEYSMTPPVSDDIIDIKMNVPFSIPSVLSKLKVSELEDDMRPYQLNYSDKNWTGDTKWDNQYECLHNALYNIVFRSIPFGNYKSSLERNVIDYLGQNGSKRLMESIDMGNLRRGMLMRKFNIEESRPEPIVEYKNRCRTVIMEYMGDFVLEISQLAFFTTKIMNTKIRNQYIKDGLSYSYERRRIREKNV